METLIDKEMEISRQIEAIIKEESIEKSLKKEEEEEEEEEKEYENHDIDSSQLIKEFEADVAFRTQKPVLPDEMSERIPALVQGRAAYRIIAGAGRTAERDEVLRPRKA